MVARRVLFVCMALCLGISGFAQQITRLAVVDMERIFAAHSGESEKTKELEDRRRELQGQIEKMQNEIRELQNKKLDAQAKSEALKVAELENTINKKRDYLKEFYRVRSEELDIMRKRLTESDSFAKKAYSVIQRIAEADGCSGVLELKNAIDSGLLIWYSPSMDITDKVLNALQ